MEILQHHRIAELEHLGIGQARIGHVRLHRVRPRKACTCRRAGALILGVAEVEIVHRALGGRKRAERAEQAIGHCLRSLDIAGRDRCRIFRRKSGG
jgi:hypothetical protein